MSTRLFNFVGGTTGRWKVRSQVPFIGNALSAVPFVDVMAGHGVTPINGWSLRGIVSNDRYVERAEKQELVAKQQGLGRDEATYAALIPIRKSATWWAVTQDERRAVFEERSQHMRIGMKYLPPIARRLHHCRNISDAEPFDFLTWFEYEPAYGSAFEDLLAELRSSEEWQYVDHEIDIRLISNDA